MAAIGLVDGDGWHLTHNLEINRRTMIHTEDTVAPSDKKEKKVAICGSLRGLNIRPLINFQENCDQFHCFTETSFFKF